MDGARQKAAKMTRSLMADERRLLDQAVLAVLGAQVEEAMSAVAELTESHRKVALDAMEFAAFDTLCALPSGLCGPSHFHDVARLVAGILEDHAGLDVDPDLLSRVISSFMTDCADPGTELTEDRLVVMTVMLEAALLLLVAPQDPVAEWLGLADVIEVDA